jgi:hypothetical protein
MSLSFRKNGMKFMKKLNGCLHKSKKGQVLFFASYSGSHTIITGEKI